MVKYEQIYHEIKEKIESGQLKNGDKLPSVRQLTEAYACNKDTVQRAFLELKHDRLVYARPRSGYYVLADAQELEESIALEMEESKHTAYEDFRLCMNETLEGREEYLFNYYKNERGLDDLLASLKTYFEQDDIYTQADNIIVTSGTQQALFILSQMAFPNGKTTILLEQPTYRRMNRLVESLHLSYLTIERGYEGIDLEELERLFKEESIKFFYTISRQSNPLGVSYQQKEKEAIIALAKQYDVYILEDDYLGDFCAKSDPPLHYFDIDEKVIYLKSFSMTLFPTLRLGTVILPKDLQENFLRYKTMIDYDTSLIMQKALSLYLNNGMFKKNTHLLREKRQEELAEMKERLSQFSISLPYHLQSKQVVLELPKKVKLGPLLRKQPFNQMQDYYIEEHPGQYIALPINEHLAEYLSLLDQRLS